ncbi:MAG: hypothetical protein QOJ89_759 [bacterium]
MTALAEVTKPAAQSTDDLELVAAVRAGDDRAFELLYERYQTRITVYVRGMVRDHGRAEDITQEVFIAALRRMRETDREILFRPWIHEIAKNACIDAFRRTRHTTEISLDAEDAFGSSDHGRLASQGAGPDAAVDTKQSIDDLCGAFGGLTQQHHEILVMREFEGLSYREIGERLGMSRAGVESTLFRARRRLSEEYEELVSGERCLRVRAIADAAGARAGLRDQRRLARHVSHCQPCRRYAMHAGVDVAALRAPATSVAAKVAALLPLPPFLRRRAQGDEGGRVLGGHGAPTLNTIATLDPSTLSGWSKAVATAATVAVAGLGAGATVKHEAVSDFIARAPAMLGLAPEQPAAAAGLVRIRALLPTATHVRATHSGADQRRTRPGESGPGALFDVPDVALGSGPVDTPSLGSTGVAPSAAPSTAGARGVEDGTPATSESTAHDPAPASAATADESTPAPDAAADPAAAPLAGADGGAGTAQPRAVIEDNQGERNGPAATDSASNDVHGAGNDLPEPKSDDQGGGATGAAKGAPEPKTAPEPKADDQGDDGTGATKGSTDPKGAPESKGAPEPNGAPEPRDAPQPQGAPEPKTDDQGGADDPEDSPQAPTESPRNAHADAAADAAHPGIDDPTLPLAAADPLAAGFREAVVALIVADASSHAASAGHS